MDDRQPGRPPGYKLPQIVLEGVVREAHERTIVTIKLPRLLRLIELTLLVVIPEKGAKKVPAYLRFFVDVSAGDAPGTVTITDD